MKKSMDQILAEKSEKEAREQLRPWKEKVEALFLETGLLLKPAEKMFYPYIKDVAIPLSETQSEDGIIREVNKSPGTVLASKILEDLFKAAVGIKTEQLLARHQENLTKHYDELTKEL
jgi:hypothetical protein